MQGCAVRVILSAPVPDKGVLAVCMNGARGQGRAREREREREREKHAVEQREEVCVSVGVRLRMAFVGEMLCL